MNNLHSCKTSIYALPDIITQLKSPDVIWSPSMLLTRIENLFNIPIGSIWLKTRSPQYSLSRYTFLYILQIKMGIDPALIRIIYGVKHDQCWQARQSIGNILSTKTPRHYYIKIEKLNSKIRRWEITEISQKLESLFAENAKVLDSRKNTLRRCMAKAQFTEQSNARLVTQPEE